ncbi:MAG: 1-deoxy-D-xylulose-5-phosphate reductoisomerase [Silicimonas sp.]|jgi:1-deoxy-D-xylulose-5-phosphate reductoisomerase|nr:1-deoxy-D-xylulose-5-phosphate reductoisomerase [Silicimonas sp.]
MKRVSILGATGSIGQNTVDLIAREPGDFHVVALTGGRNTARLADDAIRLGAEVAVIAHENGLDDLRTRLAGTSIEAAAGRAALLDAASRPTDWTMSAIVGSAGLEPGLRALANGTCLALANKESLVCAGSLLLAEAGRHDATILPVDSEHSAIFQALAGEEIAAVERIVITASGGAFRDWPLEKLQSATLAEASAHPNWDMGQRITIDSATLFNKAMEMIEAREFFRVRPEQIEVVIHPESLIHALVGFRDGALMAHVGPPDMRHAIGYALNWPERRHLPVERLDLVKTGQLTFREPDEARHPALRLAREVMETGGYSGAVFNAAKEAALDGFIAGQIGFLDMAGVVETVLERFAARTDCGTSMTLETVHAIDGEARRVASEVIATF